MSKRPASNAQRALLFKHQPFFHLERLVYLRLGECGAGFIAKLDWVPEGGSEPATRRFQVLIQFGYNFLFM